MNETVVKSSFKTVFYRISFAILTRFLCAESAQKQTNSIAMENNNHADPEVEDASMEENNYDNPGEEDTPGQNQQGNKNDPANQNPADQDPPSVLFALTPAAANPGIIDYTTVEETIMVDEE